MNHILPFPGPLHEDPTPEVTAAAGPVAGWVQDITRAQQDHVRAQLAAALEGITLGAYDRQVVGLVGGLDIGTAAAVASMLWRARQAGIAEAEAAAAARIKHLQAAGQRLAAELGDATARLLAQGVQNEVTQHRATGVLRLVDEFDGQPVTDWAAVTTLLAAIRGILAGSGAPVGAGPASIVEDLIEAVLRAVRHAEEALDDESHDRQDVAERLVSTLRHLTGGAR